MKTISTIKKITFAAVLTFIVSLSTVLAQNDTMYIMKNGAVVGQYNVNTEIDSIIFYQPTVAQNDSLGTFTDPRDGNEYNWVKIGDQVWMAENLAYLPSVNQVSDGSEDASGAYYYVYGYDGTDVAAAKSTANYNTYGVLYNWTAAMNGETSSSSNPSGIQGACPTGWHLPSDTEWTALTDYLGGTSVAGGKLKATGTSHWASPNFGASNETGFTALPGAYRYPGTVGAFIGIDFGAYWWSAAERNAADAWYRSMGHDISTVYSLEISKDLGLSVRCVRD